MIQANAEQPTAMTPEESVLNELGYFRDDTRFVSLNLTDEQWKVISEATLSSGDVSTEEMIVRALRTNKELYSALQEAVSLINDYCDGCPPKDRLEKVLDLCYAATNRADEENKP